MPSRATQPEPLAEVIPELLSTYTMLDSRGPKVWKAVTGRDIHKPDAVWRNYYAHVQRRNALVHKGKRVSEPDAALSLSAVREFCSEVMEAARQL